MSRELSIHDMQAERVELLPGREALGRIRFKLNSANVLASNAAYAVNAATFASVASANAGQQIIVSQR